jgi:hypothetical protein
MGDSFKRKPMVQLIRIIQGAFGDPTKLVKSW